ncbi:hypothetical protein O3P69_008973 [Scylla paramamosain]|uniref:Uncharacterized protein n=1 Tax=Scylla paramamosain TaxID=85552 RepID=A0AAW0TPP6_SCYPA
MSDWQRGFKMAVDPKVSRDPLVREPGGFTSHGFPSSCDIPPVTLPRIRRALGSVTLSQSWKFLVHDSQVARHCMPRGPHGIYVHDAV